MTSSIYLSCLSLSPSPSILAVIIAEARTVTVAETELSVATAKSAGTPHTFRAISGAYIQAAVFLLRGGETLHFEPLLQFLQGEAVQDAFVQRMYSISTHEKPS
jgi:hypothetical protein